MDIKDYAQMMRYLTRPRDVVPDPSSMVPGPRNMNQGGRIGFMSGLSARTQNLVSLYDIAKLDLPIPEATIRQVFQTKDRAKAYKKIFKDNGIKIVGTGKQRKALFKKPTQKQIDGVWKDTIKLVKEGKGTVPDKMRIPFKNKVLKIFDEFNQTGTPFSTSDIYYKLVENVQDNPRIFLPAKRKGGTRVPGEEIKRALGKEKADLLLDGNIQRIEKTIGNRKKLVEILSKGESDINTLAKTLNISKKDLFAEANTLFDDVYRYNSHKVRKTGWGEKYGYLKDYEIKDFKNILNNLRASGFEKLDERSIRALITDAYAETSPKKYDVAMKKLSQYNKINNQLKQVFGFNFELDHPLSFQNLKNIGNVSPENLLRVTPIPKDINRIKIGLDGTYNNILSALRSGDTSPALLNQKKAIETIAKNLGIGEFKVSKTGDKILSFGAKPFLQADLIGGMKENVHLQNKIAENLKNIDSEELETAFGKRSKIPASIKNLKPIDTKKLLKFFKDANKKLLSHEKEIMNQSKGFKNVLKDLEKLGCGKAAGGRILMSNGGATLTKCARKGQKVLEQGLKNGFKESDQVLARGILKSGRFLKDAVSLRGLFGPAALAFTAAAEAGIVGYDMLSSGKSFREAVGDSVFNYMLGDRTKIDSEEEFIKRLKNIKTGPSGLRDFSDEEIGKMQYFKESLKDMGTGFDLNSQLEKIKDRQETERGGTQSDLFSENAFNLDAERDALRADIQDYNRTGTPQRVTDYLLSDKATAGADAAKKAALLVEQDQLQDAGTGKWYQAPRGDEKRLDKLSELKYELEKMYNPTKINEFGQLFMDATPGEQSYFMGRTDFMEGGIASLNVKK